MFSNLKLRYKYASYLRNDHGIKKFAEMSLGQLIRRVAKKSAFYREMNENMLVEKANLRIRRDELYERPTLEAGAFFSVRRQLWANTLLISVILLAAIFLNVLAVETFIDVASALGPVLRWGFAALFAVVLTGGGMVMAERLFGVLIPRRNADTTLKTSNRKSMTLLWGALLVVVELVIVSMADVQASRVAATADSGLLYLGYLLAAAVLPLAAGAFRWHTMRFIDRYKTTRVLRQIESRLAQIDSLLRQNEEYESNFYKIKSIEHWDLINAFKTYKDNLNQKAGVVEPLSGHFAQSYDTFQSEANKRYTQDIRDLTAPSVRKLNKMDATGAQVGNKIGQTADAGSAKKPSKRNGTNGQSKVEYLTLKPVR